MSMIWSYDKISFDNHPDNHIRSVSIDVDLVRSSVNHECLLTIQEIIRL